MTAPHTLCHTMPSDCCSQSYLLVLLWLWWVLTAITWLSILTSDVVKQHSRHHWKSRGETHERCLCAGRWQEDADIHGRFQHASQGRIRLTTTTGTDPPVARLWVLVRQNAPDHPTHTRRCLVWIKVFLVLADCVLITVSLCHYVFHESCIAFIILSV